MADSILRLKVDSQEYDQKIKRAAEGIQRFAEQVYKSGGAVTELEKDEVAFIKALGNMETVSKSATGKLRELEGAYKNLSATYHMLQKDQQNDAGGKALRASLDQLKVRIDETRTAIKKADAELNEFSQTENKVSKGSFDLNGVLSQVGGQMGINTSLISGLTTGTLGLGAAITAVAAAEYKAAEAFKAYNDELARQSQITTVTTGLKGADADNMTAAARSISKVYGTDFREVINAANTLMTQFGTDGEFALKTIRDGMQGMIQGDGPKLLSMIQQFAPALRDAGISADQLVAIIHNSEGGLFSEQNMNAILMGIKNIRLMTKSTSDALAQLGIDGQEMSRKMSDGSMTVFEALHKVATAIEGCKAGSQEAGQVMQYVFGRQGAMQGMKLGRAIAELNTNLEDTKRQTGEVGESFAKLEKKTEELDKAIMNLLKVDNWDVLTNTIETGVVEGLTKCVNLLNDALDVVNNIGKAFGGPVVQGVVDFLVALSGPVGLIYEAYNLLKGGSGNTSKTETQEEKAQRIATGEKGIVANINSSKDKAGAYAKNMARLNKTLEKYQKEGNEEKAALTQRVIEIVEEHMDKAFSDYGKSGKKFKPVKPVVKPTKASSAAKDKIVTGSLADLTNDLKYLQQEQTKATNTKEWETYQDAIRATQMQIKELKGELKDVPASISDVAESTNKATDAQNKKIQDRLNDPATVSKGMAEVVKQIERDQNKDDKKEKKYLSEGISQLGGGLGGIQSGFKQLGVDLGSGFNDVVSGLQGVSSILMGISSLVTIITAIQGTKATPVIGWALAGGGIIKAAGGTLVGNSYSGDNLRGIGPGGQVYGLNAGEIVLNRAQAGVLASELSTPGFTNMRLETYVSGRDLKIVLNNDSESRGKGRYLTSVNYKG